MPASLHHVWNLALSICLSSAAVAAGFAPAALADDADPVMAISSFDFRDTSGEIRDQSAEHEARLKDVASTLLEGLSENGKFRPISLDCQDGGCSARTAGMEALSKEARSIDAEYLLVGEVHKMSTLIGWMKFAVLDLLQEKLVCDRFLTYRGDTDEAWHRAAEFVVRDIERNCIP